MTHDEIVACWPRRSYAGRDISDGLIQSLPLLCGVQDTPKWGLSSDEWKTKNTMILEMGTFRFVFSRDVVGLRNMCSRDFVGYEIFYQEMLWGCEICYQEILGFPNMFWCSLTDSVSNDFPTQNMCFHNFSYSRQ